MQNWTINTAEKWEELTGLSYGSFFEHLQNTTQRKAKDLAILLACEAYNSNPALDIEAELKALSSKTMAEIWQQINALFGQPADEKKKAV